MKKFVLAFAAMMVAGAAFAAADLNGLGANDGKGPPTPRVEATK